MQEMVSLTHLRNRKAFVLYSPVTRNLLLFFLLFCYSRHLLRLWLRNEELAWEIPKDLEAIWKRLYYTTTADEQTFPLEPEIRKGSRGGGAKYA